MLEELSLYDAVENPAAEFVQEPPAKALSTATSYILCLEDERPVLGMICQALENAGYTVTRVNSGQQLLALIAEHHPAVLLLDLTRRDGPSWQIYSEVKHNHRLKNMIIIDVSTRNTQLRQARIDDFPAIDDYIPKPADIERLVHSVEILACQ